MELKDSEARQRATDPEASFIVQAPAGSGKTELLTQRYLRLLSKVQAPEQIIALTFTRKAASEMKTRIMLALMDAEANKPLQTLHQQNTRNYALAALEQSRALGWRLLNNPSRLKIMTIDALCQSLAHAIPLFEKDLPFAEISALPERHYQSAARAFLQTAVTNEDWQEPISLLLEHLDNRQDRLIALLASMLSARDQWLGPVFSAKANTKEDFEDALKHLEDHELQRFIEATPGVYQAELLSLSRQLAEICRDTEPRYHPFLQWEHFQQLDSHLATSLALVCLTKDGALRKSFDHHVGLKRGVCSDKIYSELKARSKDLLESLSQDADFLEAFARIKNLPGPCFTERQWQVLQALLSLLPLLAAHLQLVFADNNEVDFTAVAKLAGLALGDEEAPTDLALFMDYSIHHLLIDEFQDTSLQQFQLLEKLVRGWEAGDGKTVFIVGDPMQSIYRFRQAEVGLFLRAQSQGIGSIRLMPLKLSCNFRATSALVAWVNAHFGAIFPQRDDMESGAISFHPSIAARQEDEGPESVIAKAFESPKEEAEALISLVQEELKTHPGESFAILVRSRNQLKDIIPLLREHKIPFQGLEIEKLSALAHIKDVWSLTKALLLPGERLPWLALLASPYCGLSLADLEVLANFDKDESIYFALSKLACIQGLSEDGRTRAEYIFGRMQAAIHQRNQQSMSEWVGALLQQLHLDKILTVEEEADLEQFFLLLAKCSSTDQIMDVQAFEKELDKLYSERVTPSALQIMTIHKSKGLEFDCVLLPGLGGQNKNKDRPLLRWLNLPSEEGETFMLSPIHARDQDKCPLYEFIGAKYSEKERYEQQRLLYVAVTRAKKRLYLLDCHAKANSHSFRELLKAFPFHKARPVEEVMGQTFSPLPELRRLDSAFYTAPPRALENLNPLMSFPSALHHPMRSIGIAAHELLQWICETHASKASILPWQMVANRLKSAGFSLEAENSALEALKNQVSAMLAHPIGAWICQAHEQEQNEHALLVKENEEVKTRIIDRTFIEKGCRWIIDFKTGNDMELSEEEHRRQVNHYARILAGEGLPLRCGLFYLHSTRWLCWDYVCPVTDPLSR